MLGSLLFTAASCGDDDPAPDEEEDQELITTATLTLVPEGKGQTVTATFSDPDGPGGTNATIETLNLAPNTTYNAAITFSDDSQTPPVDITAEIEAEGDEHQIFYEVLNTVSGQNLQENLAVTNRNNDVNGLPLGLTATVTTENTSSGALRVTLKHQGEKKNASSGISVGETDVQAEFPVVIQ